MTLSPDMVQTIVYLVLVLVGMAVKQLFPAVKLPALPSPASPAAPTPGPILPGLRDQLAGILPDLLEQFLRNRLPVAPAQTIQAVAGGSPVAVNVSTPTHNIGVDAAGAVSVAVK